MPRTAHTSPAPQRKQDYPNTRVVGNTTYTSPTVSSPGLFVLIEADIQYFRYISVSPMSTPNGARPATAATLFRPQ